jgi:putative ABC transport system permease protein
MQTRANGGALVTRNTSAHPRLRMEARLLAAGLTRRRGMVALAVLAIAIGSSVASALLHVSGDVSRKLTRELRSLGPNLLLTAGGHPNVGGAPGYLDERVARERLAAAGLTGAPLLLVTARVDGRPVQVVGGDLDALRRIHPSWSLSPGPHGSFMGARLMSRLGVQESDSLTVEFAGGQRLTRAVGARLEAGGGDDDAWWIPLADAQTLAGLAGRVSLVEIRIDGGAREAEAAVQALEKGGGARALVLHALSSTEAGLLDRMRRLMLLVTVAALFAAGLCAFGTLTDLALERRREIALMKALGASARDVVRQFAAESLAIGFAGGVLGWLLGLFFAEVIGKTVFHSAIAIHWNVPPQVVGLALLVSGLAGLGPIRLALAVEPAAALKGE